jgi:multicomponent Na+:H+ antiporter subunit E
VKYALSLLAMLLWVWMWWSGHYTLEHGLLQVFMVGSCLLVVWIVARTGGFADDHGEETAPYGWLHPVRAVGYVLWIAFEIVKANLDISRRILSPSLPIQRQLIRVRATQRTGVGVTVFANSITLTPGTVSVTVEQEEILVHAVCDVAADGLLTGDMDRRVTAWEPGPPRAPGTPLPTGAEE